MLESDDPRIERHAIDGQTLLVPSAEAWVSILVQGRLDGRSIGVGRLLQQYLALADRHPELDVALGAVPDAQAAATHWWVYHLVRIGERRLRIKVERQSCACGWAGTTGNHRDYAIYIGTADPLRAMQAHWESASVPCPECDRALPRPARWAAR